MGHHALQVLLLEDDPVETELIERALQRFGESVRVEALCEPAHLWDAVARVRPSLLLVDYTLPGTSGAAVVRELRARGTVAPIVVVSISSRPEHAREACAAGANAYLVKPISRDEHERFVAAMEVFFAQARLLEQ